MPNDSETVTKHGRNFSVKHMPPGSTRIATASHPRIPQVLRTDGVAVGTLVRLKETPHEAETDHDASTGMPHWIVKVDGGEEDISEHMLGRIMDNESDQSTIVVAEPPKRKVTPPTKKKMNKKSKGIAKVKMMTGTLYIHRGVVPHRVEFVRTK